MILILAAFLMIIPQIAHSDCVDYGEYMRQLGSVDTPRLEEEVAISGTKGYVVTRDYNGGWTSSLQVIDLSNPASPMILGSVDIPGSAYKVAVSGAWAYVANDVSGLRVIDVSNPASPTIVGTVDTPGWARGVAISGTVAYVADGYLGLQVIDVSNPATPTIIGAVGNPGFAGDVVVSGTLAYVADHLSGMTVVDVSNPASPTAIGYVDTPGSAEGIAVSGTTALIADYDEKLAIIDISDPSSPVFIQSFFVFGYVYDVAVDHPGVVFLATTEGLMTLDITDPASVTQLGNIAIKGDAAAVSVSSGLACVVKTPAGSDQVSGLEVFDASNPALPPILGYLPNPNYLEGTGYISVAIDGTRIYTTGPYQTATCPYPNPPCQSKLAIFDASNPWFPPAVTLNTPGYAYGVAASGTTAYVADGNAGLEIIDVSNPSVPQIIGNANTPGEAIDVIVSGGLAYVADGSSGLRVIDLSNPTAPVIVGGVDTPDNAWGIDVSGSLACVADRSSLQVIDVSTPTKPKIVGNVDTPGNTIDVVMSGSLAYVTDDDPSAGFQVINLSNPHTPNVLATLDLPGIANGIAVTGSIAYVADGAGGLQVIDVSNPSSPVIAGTELVSTPQSYRKIAASGQFACVINQSYPLILPLHCLTPPVLNDPGTQNWAEQKYFSLTLTATDADQGGLTMSVVGSLPAWATFSDLGYGFATLSGVPHSGEAGTYPVSIRAADDKTATTVSFNIVVAPSGQVGVGDLPLRFRLAASPNPFLSGIDLEFDLERDAKVSLVILDLQGRKVRDVVAGEFPAGKHRASWEGVDNLGHPVGPGLYFARLTTEDGRVKVQKLFKTR